MGPATTAVATGTGRVDAARDDECTGVAWIRPREHPLHQGRHRPGDTGPATPAGRHRPGDTGRIVFDSPTVKETVRAAFERGSGKKRVDVADPVLAAT